MTVQPIPVLEQRASRRIGRVSSVAPNAILVELEPDAPQGVALSSGSPMRFPRVNGFVVVPIDTGSVVGIINWIGIEPAAFPKRPGLKDYGLLDLPYPSRRMRVTPLGMVRERGYDSEGLRQLVVERGVLSLPSVGDPVLLPTDTELTAIVQGEGGESRIEIGRAALATELLVRVDPDRVFGRHLAVLGNTGSGKSCSVAGLIRWSLEACSERLVAGRAAPNARFIVLDPNGEYAKAFEDIPDARVFQVEGLDPVPKALRVPAWLWNSEEWAAFSGAAPGIQRPMLHQALRGMRAGKLIEEPKHRKLTVQVSGYLGFVNHALHVGTSAYATEFKGRMETGDILAKLVRTLADYESTLDDEVIRTEVAKAGEIISAIVQKNESPSGSKMYYNAFLEQDLRASRDALEAIRAVLPDWNPPSGPSEDSPRPFDVTEFVPHMEFLANEVSQVQFVGSLALRIQTLLGNVRMRAVVAPDPQAEPKTLKGWLDRHLGESDDRPIISILDLSLLPADLIHIVTAVVARLTFEAVQRYRKASGVELPTVLVLEEAQHFVHKSANWEVGTREPASVCRQTIERIAREGRKFGLGLVLSSQRPSEVSPTVLSQCNTYLLHRIVNDRDQDLVKSLVPDNLAGLLEDLPSLPTRHAIILGWATSAPLLVQMRHLPSAFRPRSSDPQFWDTWRGALKRPVDWKPISDDWTEG